MPDQIWMSIWGLLISTLVKKLPVLEISLEKMENIIQEFIHRVEHTILKSALLVFQTGFVMKRVKDSLKSSYRNIIRIIKSSMETGIPLKIGKGEVELDQQVMALKDQQDLMLMYKDLRINFEKTLKELAIND
ncbi:MAG: hypothetical protein CL489_10215 [Acidobacteria bacterium]|nr:hypothetical protein [Acidobacteriota bacterium]